MSPKEQLIAFVESSLRIAEASNMRLTSVSAPSEFYDIYSHSSWWVVTCYGVPVTRSSKGLWAANFVPLPRPACTCCTVHSKE